MAGSAVACATTRVSVSLFSFLCLIDPTDNTVSTPIPYPGKLAENDLASLHPLKLRSYYLLSLTLVA